MKEVMAFIRVGKVNATKEALADVGFAAFLCRPCMGRGKKSIEKGAIKYIMETGSLPMSNAGESMTESARLIPKRLFTIIIEDNKVDLAVKTIINANQTGNIGDGRIFVLPVSETYKVRTGENIL